MHTLSALLVAGGEQEQGLIASRGLTLMQLGEESKNVHGSRRNARGVLAAL